MNKEALIKKFELFTYGSAPGLGQWLAKDVKPLVSERLLRIEKEPLAKVQFNQLLVASLTPSVSDSFFIYYWCSTPKDHPYEVRSVGGKDSQFKWKAEWEKAYEKKQILSLDHLGWGLYRLYVDGLLFFGSVDAAFRALRSMNLHELEAFFRAKRFDTEAIGARGPALPLYNIGRDDRYLISEMACKTFGEFPENKTEALKILNDAWDAHEAKGGGKRIGFKELLTTYVTPGRNEEQILLSYDDIASETIDCKESIQKRFEQVYEKFERARKQAVANTELYLSMVNDLDVYVATSVVSRK